MKLSQRVRVHVGKTDGKEELVAETAMGRIRNRLLARLLGNQYGVFLVLPRGTNVETVEIVESGRPPG